MLIFIKNILKNSLLLPFKVRNKIIDEKLKHLNEEQKFSLIYKSKYWTSFIPGSASGSGSNLNATKNIRNELPKILQKYHINSILDLPCGDFYWMSKLNLDNIRYIGGDIVEDLIKSNNKKYQRNNCSFNKINLLEDILPEVDLIFTRDCLVHLTNDQVTKAINNILNSNSKYFMTTTFENIQENQSYSNGDRWRAINLTIEPFNLPQPLAIIDDSFLNGQDMHKKMYLWEISTLKNSDLKIREYNI
ncbi:MAG: class I SAM-dependent methyltransferase [Epsilonproteobacteria bacterium]|nr:class I SAM-dependent methyltransferase [Campylobacterota bacterium]